MILTISNREARHLILTAQGLTLEASNSDLLETIRRLSYVQIDTLSVTERAHHHVLFTRSNDYEKEMLSRLMLEGPAIFEYWSHAAAYLPIEDFKFSLPRKRRMKSKYKLELTRTEKRMMKYTLDAIRTNGPMRSKDFVNKGHRPDPWFDYKPAKRALERLFWEGSLMVSHRINFQKVYDLPERVLNENIDCTMPNVQEMNRHLILNGIKSQGLATIDQMSYLRRGIKKSIANTVEKMVRKKELIEVRINNAPSIYYTIDDQIAALNQKQANKEVFILSPFDNLVIQRKRLKNIFDFQYNIECYVPAKHRKFGYYVLPVLYGDEMVARFDSKADRKMNIFTVKKLFLETNFTPDDLFWDKFERALNRFAAFCGCDNVIMPESHCKKQN